MKIKLYEVRKFLQENPKDVYKFDSDDVDITIRNSYISDPELSKTKGLDIEATVEDYGFRSFGQSELFEDNPFHYTEQQTDPAKLIKAGTLLAILNDHLDYSKPEVSLDVEEITINGHTYRRVQQ